jgi:tetratricopeptide (TPR) repeat protein
MAAMRPRHAVARFALATLVAASASGIAVTTSTPAWADTHADAVKAFDEGRKLRETDAEKAVRAFERSISLEPSIGAYYNLGQVNEQLDRLRDAVDAFRKAEKLAIQKGDPRKQDAQEAWGKILGTHDYVVVNVSDEVQAAPGLVVSVDGTRVPPAQLNGEVFRPTQSHDVVVSAAAHKDLRLTSVPNKQPVTITLGEASAPPSAAPLATPPAEASSGWGWQKWTGIGMMAVGAGGIAYSLISFLGYKSDESSLADTRTSTAQGCTGPGPLFDQCTKDPTGTRLRTANEAIAAYDANERSAKDAEPIWIIAGSAGVVLVGVGVYLFATAPSRSSEPTPPAAGAARWQVIPRVGTHDSGLSVVGTF